MLNLKNEKRKKKRQDKDIILFDFTNFSSFGGVEKNGRKLALAFKDISDDEIKIAEKSSQLFWQAFLHSIGVEKIRAVFIFKGSALTSLLFRILTIRIVSRVNNSPEAYLHWRGLSSVLSFAFRIYSLKNDMLIFNSKKIMNFYQNAVSSKINCYYLPNFVDEIPDFTVRERSKIFLASRYSKEKNIPNTLNILESFNSLSNFEISYFSSSSSVEGKNIAKKFDELEINFNDIFVSMAFFEGMPNMALEAFKSGAILILSNCWSHVELSNDLKVSGLGDRILVLDLLDDKAIETQISDFIHHSQKCRKEQVAILTKEYFGNLNHLYQQTIANILKKI